MIRTHFARFTHANTVAPNCNSLSCLKETPGGADYYVVPEILHWEDRATEWSGIPDKVEIKISVFDKRQTELASTLISGKSKWVSPGGDHLQDLLAEPLNRCIESLYSTDR